MLDELNMQPIDTRMKNLIKTKKGDADRHFCIRCGNNVNPEVFAVSIHAYPLDWTIGKLYLLLTIRDGIKENGDRKKCSRISRDGTPSNPCHNYYWRDITMSRIIDYAEYIKGLIDHHTILSGF
jgi:hypothetical protein